MMAVQLIPESAVCMLMVSPTITIYFVFIWFVSLIWTLSLCTHALKQ